LLAKKIALEKEKKELEAAAEAKEKELNAKVGTIGNIVHDSVPVSNNEVGCSGCFGMGGSS
jgi:seryl-tRNA synthetase